MFENIQIVDWARLAAFIDGEGCIEITKYKGMFRKNGTRSEGFTMKVTITNTDPRLIVWLKKFGVGSFYIFRGGERKGYKPRFDWVICSRQARDVLIQCMPYFVMKADQAELAIAFSKTQSMGGQKLGVPHSVKAERALLHGKLKASRTPPPMERIQ